MTVTRTISIAPSYAGLVHHLLQIQARPDDCSDLHDVPKDQLQRRQKALAEAKSEVERTFMICAQVADLVDKHVESMPQEFIDGLEPIMQRYRDGR